MNRRHWIKTGAGLAFGLGAAPLFARQSVPDFHWPADKVTRLRANENPYGPSPKAREALRASAALSNRYPMEHYEQLRKQLAEMNSLTPDHILITAGSFEVLRLTGQYLARRGHSFLTCAPTFDWMLRHAERLGAPCRRLPLDEHWRFDLEALADRAESKDVIYLCNPNNPTATTWPAGRVRDFCESVLPKHYVLADEAYIEYTTGGIDNSVAPLLEKHPNLIISRTFSKLYGLAGSRVGYMMAHPDLIRALEETEAGHTLGVSLSALMAAQAGLGDAEFVRECRLKNERVKTQFTTRLDEWRVPYTASEVNFIFMESRPFKDQLGEALKQENILVAPLPTKRGEWCRITIGTGAEMERLAAVLEKWN